MLCCHRQCEIREIVDLTNGNIKTFNGSIIYMRDVTPVVTWLAEAIRSRPRKSGPGTGRSSQIAAAKSRIIDFALIAIWHIQILRAWFQVWV